MARKYTKRQSTRNGDSTTGVDCTALYVRVSTDKQAEEGYSLDAQKERLQAFCDAQGWRVCAEHMYVDAGVSGKSTDKREALAAMLQAAETGAVNRIVAMKLDRLARNTRDFLNIVDRLNKWGCALVLVKESFDTSTPHGKFALTMFAAMAELEASTITERTMSGKLHKAKEGGYNGARIPLGYQYDGEIFRINEDEAATVRGIFARFVDGDSLTAIANALNERDTPTKTGAKWYPATVRYVLQNGFYAGLAQYDSKDESIEGAGEQPSIVARGVYEQAHTRMLKLKPGPQRRQATDNEDTNKE